MTRGGFQVEMAWEDGKLVDVVIISKLGNTLELRYGTSEISMGTIAGQALELDHMLQVI